MPFLDSDTCARRELFISVRIFFLYDAIHGWMMRRMDGWTSHMMKKASRKTTTTSFNICKGSRWFAISSLPHRKHQVSRHIATSVSLCIFVMWHGWQFSHNRLSTKEETVSRLNHWKLWLGCLSFFSLFLLLRPKWTRTHIIPPQNWSLLQASPLQTESCFSVPSYIWSWSSCQTKQNKMGNSKILIVGATGAIGSFITQASARLGHPTFALVRPDTAGPHSSKKELIDSFKASGITILEVNRLNPRLFSFFNSFLSCEVQ